MFCKNYNIIEHSEKSSCPQNCLSAILEPEMAAPILWALGKYVLSAGKTMSVKFLLLGGGLGGGECRFYFYGREDFSEK